MPTRIGNTDTKRFGRNRWYTSGQENFWNCLSCRRVTRGGKKSRDGEKKKERKRQLFWSKLFRCAFHDGSRNSPLDGATGSVIERSGSKVMKRTYKEKGPISNYLVSSRLGRTSIFAHHCPPTFYRHSTGVGEGIEEILVKTGNFILRKILRVFSYFLFKRIFIRYSWLDESDGWMMILCMMVKKDLDLRI